MGNTGETYAVGGSVRGNTAAAIVSSIIGMVGPVIGTRESYPRRLKKARSTGNLWFDLMTDLFGDRSVW